MILIGGLGLFLLTAALATGPDRHLSVRQAEADGPEQTGLTGLKADLKIILQDRFGRSSSSEHPLYKSETLVRIDLPSRGAPESNLPEGQRQVGPAEDIYIYDYTRRKQYRLIPSSKIYFETVIPQSGLIEAQREGLLSLPDPPNIETKKVLLAETTFDGHPCRLSLQIKSLMAGEGSKKKRVAVEYALLWEAADLGNFPVRIVYTGPDYITKIIEYRNARWEPMDASLFQPPKGFRRLSPF